MGTAVVLGAGAQVAARGANLLLSLVATLAISRYLGPSGFGDYVFILGFVTLLGLFSDFGLTKIAVRDMAQRPEEEAIALGNSVLTRLALALACWLAAQGVAVAMGMRIDLRLALGVASLLCVGDALLAVAAIFHVRIAAQYEAGVSAASQLLETLAVFAVIALGGSLVVLFAIAVAARLAGVALAWHLARRRFGVALGFDLARVPPMLREAAPVGITFAIAVIYLKLDGVLLGVMTTSTDVGLYGAASKLTEYPLLGLSVALSPLFPLLARWWLADRARFLVAHRMGADGLMAVTLPLPVLAALVGPSFLLLVYPREFAASASALTILCVALVLIVHNAWQGFSLLAAGFQRVTLAYDLAGLAVNVALNVALIERFGYVGAAWAALGTSLFIAACAGVASIKLLAARPASMRLAGVASANLVLAAALWLLLAAGLPTAIAALLALASYPGLLLLFRVARLADLRRAFPATPLPWAGARGMAGL